MAKVNQYRQIIQELLTSLATSNESEIECQFVCDTKNDHYQIVEMGWQGSKRIFACYIHIDIKDEKVWIQHNMTEVDLGQALVDKGIPASDIILGLQPQYKRPYTKYGIA